MASIQQPPPPPPPVPLSSGKQDPSHRPLPRPQHAALPILPYPPVQETSGSSQANVSENGSAPLMQNGLQFAPSQDSTGPEPGPDGDEEKRHLPVQETDPAPQALGQQTSGSRVPDEADAQAGGNREVRVP